MIRHLFILNPEAGIHNPVAEATRLIKEAFILNTDRKDEKYEIVLTKRKGDATEIVRRACRENSDILRIYACGGDGTLHEAANGMVGFENVSLCPVPVGSGNDFVRNFAGLEKEDFLNISELIKAPAVSCDLMRCGDFYALNNISAGLDATACKWQKKIKKVPFVSGGAAYTLALGYSFVSSMKNTIRFEIDGEELLVGDGFVTLAVLGNGRFYGGGFQATPLAELSDGLIDFATVPTISRAKFLKYVGDYKAGKHLETIPELIYKKCKKVKMISPEPIPLQVDGELFFIQDPEIEIVPNAIQLIIPKQKNA